MKGGNSLQGIESTEANPEKGVKKNYRAVFRNSGQCWFSALAPSNAKYSYDEEMFSVRELAHAKKRPGYRLPKGAYLLT